jgi:hypothetical protein
VGLSARRLIVPAAALLMLVCVLRAAQAPPVPQAASAAPGAGPAPDVITILMRASNYLSAYVKALSSVVSEERYEQVLTRKRDGMTAGLMLSRTLLSDYLLVALPGSSEWMPFRDVYAVDGVAIRDRSDRLLKLFVEAPADAYTQALRIRDESSRYNLGSGARDINVPTFALQVLADEWRGGFSFRLKGRERIDDIDAAVVEFVETSSPTIIVGRKNRDVPSRGRFWIDPADGRILRTLLETRPEGGINSLEVRFRYEPKLDLLLPGEMIERRNAGLEVLEGRATYTNFRRFRVDTSIDIK